MDIICKSTLLFLFLMLLVSSTTKAEEHYMDVNVTETAGIDRLSPVSGGIPIAEGTAPMGSNFILLDSTNKPLPCQFQVLAKWKDESVKWVLLDFQSKPPANGTAHYKLIWNSKNNEAKPTTPIKTVNGKTLSVVSGSIKLAASPNALLRISDRYDVKLVFTDKLGKRCEAVVETSKIETAGEIRTTLALAGSFRTNEGKRVVDFRLRASVYAGLTQLYLEPQILVNADNGIITYLNDLSLEFVPLHPIQSASIGGSPGWKGNLSEGKSLRLFQVDDERYQLEGTEGSGSKAPGWIEINDAKGKIALTLRDFWQQWPKSLEVSKGVVKLGLFPYFKEGSFDHLKPWYKYDYLFEGNFYRLREGQNRRWQISVDLSGKGDELSKSANRPLIASANPVQAIKTGEWGFIAAAGSNGMAEYDTWADNLFESYCRSIENQRDYGAMNWGDWWGERRVNWGNHEYDTPLHILIQYARTGNPKYFYVGEQAARHTSEVDVVHFLNPDLRKYFSEWEYPGFPQRPGMMHEHTIGHVAGFHPYQKIRDLYNSLNRSPNTFIPIHPFDLGHIWTLGMTQYYLLTGDPWVKETVERMGESLILLTENSEFNQFKGGTHSGRANGWSMLALAGVYKINPTERCLKAMRYIADEALVEQNPTCGGWLYSLTEGHCNCSPLHHVGEAGFISSIRLNGLSYYYRLTGDERIPNALQRGATFLNNDTWQEQYSDWRYTSCPATKPIRQIGTIVMALVNSVNITGDKEQLRILKKAWDAKFKRLLNGRAGTGKDYSQTMYGSPEAMNLFVNGIDGN